MVPPRCRIGTITDEERAMVRARSPVGSKYDTAINRESAQELLAQRNATPPPAAPGGKSPASNGKPPPAGKPAAEDPGMGGMFKDWLLGSGRRQGAIEAFTKQTARTVGSQLGRQILRGILGGSTRR
jgi:hypothetical protein